MTSMNKIASIYASYAKSADNHLERQLSSLYYKIQLTTTLLRGASRQLADSTKIGNQNYSSLRVANSPNSVAWNYNNVSRYLFTQLLIPEHSRRCAGERKGS